MTNATEDTEYEVTFVIDGIMAGSAEEAATIVADILTEDAYAHRAFYTVKNRNTDNAPVGVDLAETNAYI